MSIISQLSSTQIAIGAAIIIALFILLVYLFTELKLSRVKRTSQMYAEITKLNSQLSYADYPDKYSFRKECSKKSEFDRFDLDDYLLTMICDDVDACTNLVHTIEENRAKQEEYLKQFDAIENKLYTYDTVLEQTGMSEEAYQRAEQKVCERKRIKREFDLTGKVRYGYVSPTGRNNYSDELSFDFERLRACLTRYEAMEEFQKSKQYQRSLMTDKLRYEIMKRDGFKCQICGASKADGAILEVDHTIPVAKGGLTEPSNLRTLCKSCNRGKSDKYDPDGIN